MAEPEANFFHEPRIYLSKHGQVRLGKELALSNGRRILCAALGHPLPHVPSKQMPSYNQLTDGEKSLLAMHAAPESPWKWQLRKFIDAGLKFVASKCQGWNSWRVTRSP